MDRRKGGQNGHRINKTRINWKNGYYKKNLKRVAS